MSVRGPVPSPATALPPSRHLTTAESIKDAASTAAWGMMRHYQGNESGQIPGKLPNTWWEGGAMFMTLIEYWHFTGDSTYNDEVTVGMQWQAGDDNYFPSNWSTYLVCAPSLANAYTLRS